jgi:hypothetical protein
MQPIEGNRKEGTIGALKGVGKGIGGLALKPVAGKLLIHPRLTLTWLTFFLRHMGCYRLYF